MNRVARALPALLVLALSAADAANAQNTIAVTPAAALGPSSSTRGLQVNLADAPPRNPAWVVAGPGQGFDDETTLRGSFFVDSQGLTMSSTPGSNSFQMVVFMDGVGPNTKTRLIFHLNRSAGGWFLNVWHWNDNLGGGNFQFSGGSFFALANNANWHNNRLDFQWNAGNPGHLTMWRTRYINGAPDASGTIQMFSIDLPGMQSATVNDVFAGMFGSQDPGTSGVLYLDEFSFGR